MVKLAAPLDPTLLIIQLIQISPTGIDFHMRLPERRDDHLRNASEGTAPGLLVAVLVAADEEAADGDSHRHRGDAEPPPPPHVLLDVHQGGGGDQGADVDGEVEPVEKGRLPFLLFYVVLVELIGPGMFESNREDRSASNISTTTCMWIASRLISMWKYVKI